MAADNVLEQQVVAEGAMGIDGGLERHDRLIGREGMGNFGRDVQKSLDARRALVGTAVICLNCV